VAELLQFLHYEKTPSGEPDGVFCILELVIFQKSLRS